jgi:hypothetical protein
MSKLKIFAVAMSIAVVGSLVAAGAAHAAASSTTYSGQATVVDATVLGTRTVLADTGPLPATGGAQEASLLEASVPGLLSAEVLHASTVAQGNRSQAEASVANLDLTVGGHAVSAGFLMSRAQANCSAGKSSVSGSSDIAVLVIDGQRIAVTGEPNQTVTLPNGAGRVVINEQQASSDSITVNALHIVLTGVADVVIASSHADIHCGPACNVANDFVTGGGWITGTPSGARGTFGVAGGYKNGSLWGHLTYIDHGTKMKVKGTSVLAYTATDETTRHIEGTALIDGTPGTYSVDVSDKGEPGRSDTFTLRLSNGYTASGSLVGGNIQLHKPSCR